MVITPAAIRCSRWLLRTGYRRNPGSTLSTHLTFLTGVARAANDPTKYCAVVGVIRVAATLAVRGVLSQRLDRFVED